MYNQSVKVLNWSVIAATATVALLSNILNTWYLDYEHEWRRELLKFDTNKYLIDPYLMAFHLLV